MTEKIGRTTKKAGRDGVAAYPRLNRPSLFGGPVRTAILIVLALLEDSYPRELARMIGASLSSTQLAVERLEGEGVIATRLIGKSRRVSLSPRYFAARQVRDLLVRLAEGYPEMRDIAASVRRRPRRRGKDL